jgi:Fe-S-cluster containining protein
MSETFRESLPAVYRALLPAFFDEPAIVEAQATCNDCAMCDKGASPAAGSTYFQPDTKCCTFHPHLPGYLAGAVFRDPDPAMAEGARRLRMKIERRVGVTPRWIAAPRKTMLLFTASRETSFGRSKALLCPYYEPNGGLCTIWRHRESSCSTFFCKHDAGGDGKTFWQALELWLRHLEKKLCDHAMSAVAPELVEPSVGRGKLTREDLEDLPPPPAEYASFWGSWEGREEDLYGRCHEVISALGAADFERIVADEEGARLHENLKEKHAAVVSPRLAERLAMNAEMAVKPVDGGVVVTTFSRYEPVMLSEGLYEVVREIGGSESVAEVRARLLRDHGVDVPEAMLLSLQQHRVLLPIVG